MIVISTDRLRNLTTAHLHTTMGHVYDDISTITGIARIDLSTEASLANWIKAVQPWLKDNVNNPTVWVDGLRICNGTFEELPEPTVSERVQMKINFEELIPF